MCRELRSNHVQYSVFFQCVMTFCLAHLLKLSTYLLEWEQNSTDPEEMLIALWAYKLFLCVGFPDADNDIALWIPPDHHWALAVVWHDMTVESKIIKTFQDYLVKFKDFNALNLAQYNSRLFKILYGPWQTYSRCFCAKCNNSFAKKYDPIKTLTYRPRVFTHIREPVCQQNRVGTHVPGVCLSGAPARPPPHNLCRCQSLCPAPATSLIWKCPQSCPIQCRGTCTLHRPPISPVAFGLNKLLLQQKLAQQYILILYFYTHFYTTEKLHVRNKMKEWLITVTRLWLNRVYKYEHLQYQV